MHTSCERKLSEHFLTCGFLLSFLRLKSVNAQSLGWSRRASGLGKQPEVLVLYKSSPNVSFNTPGQHCDQSQTCRRALGNARGVLQRLFLLHSLTHGVLSCLALIACFYSLVDVVEEVLLSSCSASNYLQF